MPWTVVDIPSQAGRTALVTGANSGLGYHTALELARRGAEVVLAVRSKAKGLDAADRIRAETPRARLEVETLDVASLDSVRAFAERWGGRPVHLLVANAGVMAVPVRQETADGFELQFATNFLGHFALGALLLPNLRAASNGRMVSLSSLAHLSGRIDLNDLQGERGYKPWKAYGQSKLAMLMWALEWTRRSERAGWGVTAVAAHPGYARTNLQAAGPNLGKPMPAVARAVIRMAEPLMSQSAEEGALPVLRAATEPAAVPGGYWGPGGFIELTGAPRSAKIAPHAQDRAVAAGLWAEAERLTGVSYPS
jgi:NAD(P)-dependent dehydrogenase (short-subunit alcohol dehydrogenase family)